MFVFFERDKPAVQRVALEVVSAQRGVRPGARGVAYGGDFGGGVLPADPGRRWFASCWPLRGQEDGLTLAEFVAIVAAVVVLADYNHFTWWAVTSYGIFLGLHLFGLSSRTWVFGVCVQGLVVLGVVAMSVLGCDTLVDAASDNGWAVYVLGNFAMHYWPTIGILLRRPPGAAAHAENQAWSATMLFLLYSSIKRPNNVYGCAVPYNGVVVGGFVAGAALSAAIADLH